MITTAKELAYKAFKQNWVDPKDDPYSEEEKRARFESWWSEWYYDGNRESFHHIHNVYVDGARYIKAE